MAPDLFEHSQYIALSKGDEGIKSHMGRRPSLSRASAILLLGYFVLIIWTLALLSITSSLHHLERLPEHPLQLYSPLQHVIEYEYTTFSEGTNNATSIYMGTPTDASNKAWDDITRHGLINLDAVQMKMLYNSPLPRDSDEEHVGGDEEYIGSVDMFHQLHCLERIRTHIWAESPEILFHREKQGNIMVDHIDHCIDYLRQTLMCHGDVGIRTFSYNPHLRTYRPSFDVVRICRKFEPLVQWADLHQAVNFDLR
ncbi:hypothetical protein N431DRAFT_474365 [Stipitochalara longipes BDJ]|nr:hypothetical protein N431DRAFT_474365 [Stipitochalara longipes BDJ]